ncbi:hypothetical protein Bbelb_144130 [Branchiostoma belcheri]|nr:hypothetical protein Bbelb_144130 [Branchiostoma belcheri]
MALLKHGTSSLRPIRGMSLTEARGDYNSSSSAKGWEIRLRIFQIWSSTLCRNSQGRCGNHCKKQEEPVKTLLVPGRGLNPRPPGHQNFIARRSNHSAKRYVSRSACGYVVCMV